MRESLAPQLRPPALTAAITLIVHEAGLHAALGDSSGNVRIAAQVLAFIEPILAILYLGPRSLYPGPRSSYP
jgi:hypothetical protein